MKRVLASGVFDVFHAGHLYFLEQASKFGDYLIVLITCDPVAAAEGKKPRFGAKLRAKLLTRLKVADRVVVGRSDGDIVKTVKALKPDVIVLGFDQKFREDELAHILATQGWRGTIVRVGKLPNAR